MCYRELIKTKGNDLHYLGRCLRVIPHVAEDIAESLRRDL